PGSAAPGTNGCISNCGTDIILSGPPDQFRSVTYFEGYAFTSRSCLYMDARQIDNSKYTHVHYAFATLSEDYEVVIGDGMADYEFQNFRIISGPKRILSFGGWDFSTKPDTYHIFREGVTEANRLTMATNIANFIIDNNLDGVDIDWDYPGAPDIPGIPSASTDDGMNYFAFLVILRNLLGHDRSISIAAPSSYWYLKGYPITLMSNILDYIVFMTYDLHGQWDYANAFSNPGCPTGNCLRSQVNLTETLGALSMITKAHVPSNKIVVGITSYGRSFEMAEAGCYIEECLFTGSPAVSNAAEGPCTGTAGYISDAEIKAIIADPSRVNQNFVDASSNTNVLIYDDVQWVEYMDADTKKERQSLYRLFQMGGTTEWATDLEDYLSPPAGLDSWFDFTTQIKLGGDPYIEGTRTGNWTSLTCSDPAVEGVGQLTPAQRWAEMDCDNAWMDAINVWKTVDRISANLTFSQSIANTFHVAENANCGSLVSHSNCDATITCQGAVGVGSGPGGYEVWNTMVLIHEAYANFHDALFQAASTALFPGFASYENAFAPVPDDDSTTLQVLLDLIGVLGAFASAMYFNEYLTTLPSFLASLNKDTVKDGTAILIAVAIAFAKAVTVDAGKSTVWNAKSQQDFAKDMGTPVYGWGNAYTIPVGWTLSGTHAFVLDSGYDCSITGNPLDKYMSESTALSTWHCYNNKMYYLVAASGDGSCGDSLFTAPPGLGEFKDGAYGGLTLGQIVEGSVNTYPTNGNQNGGGPPDLGDSATLNNLMNQDVTTPGYMRLPVCSAQMAYYNWDSIINLNSSLASAPNFPCNTPQGENYCGASSFTDDTSSASPTVSDCQQIVTNIQLGGDWTVSSSGVQSQLVQFGTCAFGIQGQGLPVGNVDFTTGNQDIIDIINAAISQFQFNGLVGAKGTMSCSGNAAVQNVLWGLYHTK
ncbi:glycoside hydrolase superfamily, partial [Xylariales sp. PMI_506]